MLLILLILLLVSNALSTRRENSILYSRIVINCLILISFIAYNNLNIRGLDKGIGIYGGLFNVTTFTQSFNIFILVISAIILSITAFYPRRFNICQRDEENTDSYNEDEKRFNRDIIPNKTGEQFRIIEYPLIIVFILCGAIFLMSSADLISIFLSIELQSYALYILCTLYRNSESATASGLTYFLLGGLSSCFILLGSALLYANSGTTNLDNIYVITSISEITGTNNTLYYLYQPYYFHLSLIIICVGFLFKVSAAPFHFWSPDVYDGIPTIVTTYVAIVGKISIFAFLLELVYYTEYFFFDFSIKTILILSSLFSLIIGSVSGLTQFRIKRLFAYSTISHVGFVLLALSINSSESIQSYIFYILQYTLSNLNAFMILITIGFSLYLYVYKDSTNKFNLIDENNSPIQIIEQIKGYFYINPFIALSLSITLFSFVGIPPLVGFFAKQMVLSAALDSGVVFITFIGVVTSVVGAAYYLNLIKQIFFYKEDYIINPALFLVKTRFSRFADLRVKMRRDYNRLLPYRTRKAILGKLGCNIEFKRENITINSYLSICISIITLLLLLFIFIPNEWFNIVSTLTLIFFRA